MTTPNEVAGLIERLRAYHNTCKMVGSHRDDLNNASYMANEAADMLKRLSPTEDNGEVVQADGLGRTDADLLRLIAKDHERLAPNAYHSAETLRQIADRLAGRQSPDSLVEGIQRAIASFEQDPPATDFQRGYLAALRNSLSKSPSDGEGV